ncbi:response regulator [Massilia sp. CF038]|uniref:response regulator n=1 Tax=Massilia sp. CF038 TaxID=1881045 RepID=UPI000918BB75|nr:response regulator [Massilia sp. CF038]SHH18061.1 two-component system, OmpR family, response regulator BaeR [Massilia sp. CF038]
MSARHVLVVEDDVKIAALLADYLEADGHRVSRIGDGAQALAFLRQEAVDLILLDLMLPGLDGLEVCRQARSFTDATIIMITARVDEVDRLLGLDSGADDYICKPFSPREVAARVRAHLRRSAAHAATATPLAVDRRGLRIMHGGAVFPLTPVEFRILAELIEHAGRVYSRQQLLDLAHEDQRDINDRTVDSHIKNIRRKLAAVPALGECLQSVYGVGYRFDAPV